MVAKYTANFEDAAELSRTQGAFIRCEDEPDTFVWEVQSMTHSQIYYLRLAKKSLADLGKEGDDIPVRKLIMCSCPGFRACKYGRVCKHAGGLLLQCCRASKRLHTVQFFGQNPTCKELEDVPATRLRPKKTRAVPPPSVTIAIADEVQLDSGPGDPFRIPAASADLRKIVDYRELNSILEEGKAAGLMQPWLAPPPAQPTDWDSLLFEGYDFNAEDAVVFFPRPGGGQLVALVNAKQTHKMACYLLSKALPTDPVWLSVYTFDLADIVEGLKRTKRIGAQPLVTADHKSSLGQQTREQVAKLQALRAAGIEVRLVAGSLIQEEYSRIGRSVPPGRGICHMKMLMVGRHLLIGSTNWTTSSKCNQEIGALIQLSDAGIASLATRRAQLERNSVPFTDSLVTEAQLRQEDRRIARARSASPSPIRPRRISLERAIA